MPREFHKKIWLPSFSIIALSPSVRMVLRKTNSKRNGSGNVVGSRSRLTPGQRIFLLEKHSGGFRNCG